MKPLVLTALCALGACAAVGPHYRSPQIALPGQFVGAGTAANPMQGQSQWWQAYKDPMLSALIARGLQQNLDVQLAMERVRASQATLRTTGVNSAFDGTYAVTAERQLSEGGGAQNSSPQALNSSLVLDLFGGLRRASEGARAGMSAAEADLATARLAWLAEMISTYGTARFDQTALALTRQTIATREKTVEITRRQFDAGLATDYQMAQAQALLDTARADLPNYEARFNANVFALATLLDEPAAPILAQMQKGARQLRTPGPSATGVPADLLRNRPDIHKAEASLRQAVAAVGVAEADLYPSVTLTGSFDRSGGNASWSFGPKLTLPVFNRGRLSAARDEKISEAHQAELSWRSAVMNAVEQVQVAKSNLSNYGRRQAALARAASNYDKALALAQQSYDSGAISLLDLLDTDRSAAAARLAAASAANDAALGSGAQP
jgi:multidrug efflux system outer membrane protein